MHVSPMPTQTNLIMDRAKPKRLWNVETMKVEMYRNIQADVENNGYVCASHVWGNQQYPSSRFKIFGVDWGIPLRQIKYAD
jgi:hypothetical protein